MNWELWDEYLDAPSEILEASEAAVPFSCPLWSRISVSGLEIGMQSAVSNPEGMLLSALCPAWRKAREVCRWSHHSSEHLHMKGLRLYSQPCHSLALRLGESHLLRESQLSLPENGRFTCDHYCPIPNALWTITLLKTSQPYFQSQQGGQVRRRQLIRMHKIKCSVPKNVLVARCACCVAHSFIH